ncbi:protein ROOT HAIR SPECIFIC 17-like [Argentina anserina]|uniref:protein ROOT HAIR SPECIFIC 17-like n=1 Tax=Argentina anserina TaxID=57926 RepID=UPI0021767A28|nr:protein ROOT HAIR SPECIFIC 17-like [Potentilla anserina]
MLSSPMKKKKREKSEYNSPYSSPYHSPGSSVRRTAILRRHVRHFRYYVFPLVSAVSGCLLLVIVLFSLLGRSPPLRHHDHLSLLRFHASSAGKGVAEAQLNTDEMPVFRVPESGGSSGPHLWSTTKSELFFGCSNAGDKFLTADAKTLPNRYLLIAASGGLNQQRTGITDAVVAAYILNATLVVPTLDHTSFWKDSSNFGEIFDEDWFISFLSNDVKIIKELPSKGGKPMNVYTMRVPRKCNVKCYLDRVVPVLNRKHAVQLTKFDYRLSNKLDIHLQKLRCRTNYHALKFTDTINEMGRKLVERMKMKNKNFIALHLRFEPDMLAFSGCYFGGGEKERNELGAIRKRWKTLHEVDPDKVRKRGRCPLSPEEVGLMLRGLGFGSDVHLYVASGEVYKGEETLAPLKALFPNFHTKETIASEEELEPFSSFSSRMAALDFIVCDESGVFVTNNNGNMARILAGRRRYFGHKPTIRPNAKKLYELFVNQNNMTWEEFASRVRTSQIGSMGAPKEIREGKGVFHENPTACICSTSNTQSKDYAVVSEFELNDGSKLSKEDDTSKDSGYAEGYTTDKDSGYATGYTTDDEQYWSEMDYVETGNKSLGNGTSARLKVLRSHLPELLELFSD